MRRKRIISIVLMCVLTLGMWNVPVFAQEPLTEKTESEEPMETEESDALEVKLTPLFDVNKTPKGRNVPFSVSITNLTGEKIDTLCMSIDIDKTMYGGSAASGIDIAHGFIDGIDYGNIEEGVDFWTEIYNLQPNENRTLTGKIKVPTDEEDDNDSTTDICYTFGVMVWNVDDEDESSWDVSDKMEIKLTDEAVKLNQNIFAADISKTMGDRTFPVGAVLTFGDGKLSYTSSNQKVATVSEDGMVTLKSAGTTDITVTAAESDGFLAASKTIRLTVKPQKQNPDSTKPVPDKKAAVKVKTMKLSGFSKQIAVGKSIQLAVKISPANAKNKAVTWSSSNTKIAKVSKNGKVTMNKKSGGKKVTIYATAKDGSKVKASYTIKSMKGVVKKIAISGKKSVKAGRNLKLKAKVTASKGANKKIKWTSSNKKYATVSASGKVKTYKAGKGKKVKITAQATDGSNKKKTVTIKIK